MRGFSAFSGPFSRSLSAARLRASLHMRCGRVYTFGRVRFARLGERQSFVSRYKKGERRLDVIEYLEVAKALSVRPTGHLPDFLRMLERSPARPHTR